MKYLVYAVSMVTALLWAPQLMAATVQCSCKNVSARGEGSTSCSVSVDSGVCIVSYNAFEERLLKAQEYASKYGNVEFSKLDPSLNVPEGLNFAAATSNNFPVAVGTYLTTALLSQPTDEALNALPRIFAALAPLDDVLKRFFLGKGITTPADPEPFDSDGVTGVVAPGCIEASIGGVWVMLKLVGSPSAPYPFCGKSQ